MLGSSLLPVARCRMACQRSADSCESRSITSTFMSSAAAIARCRASVVFPAPPFGLTMLHTFMAVFPWPEVASVLVASNAHIGCYHKSNGKERVNLWLWTGSTGPDAAVFVGQHAKDAHHPSKPTRVGHARSAEQKREPRRLLQLAAPRPDRSDPVVSRISLRRNEL